MAVEWVDQDTLKALDWQQLWADYAPVTAYGRRAKATATPYLPGREGDLQQVWDQLRRDLAVCSPERTEQVLSQLQNWPDIAEALAVLEEPTLGLTPKHLLGLKQFAFRGLRLAEGLANFALGGSSGEDSSQPTGPAAVSPGHIQPGLVWSNPSLWENLLTMLGAPDSSVFSFHHVADAAYRQAGLEHAQVVQKLAVLTRERDTDWYHSTGQRVRRDATVVLNLPEQQDLAQALKHDARVRWLHDTPFESVFELGQTKAMAAAEAELAVRVEHLAAAADGLLKDLTNTLRRQLSQWRRAAADLCDLDLRCARVRLARLWHGCVPDLGARMELQDGVHPIVAKQLKHRGKSYVPLTFAPNEGVNLVFGSNMGGKTVAMSLLAVCQLAAQYGLPAPAKGFRTRLFPAIRFCVSAEGDLAAGLSSFGREVTRLNLAWSDLQACGDGLLCLDEPGRSTNPLEGEALVVGLMRAATAGGIGERSVLVLASHFSAVLHEPTVAKYRVRGLRPGWRDGFRRQGDSAGAADASGVDALEEWMDYRLERIEGEADFVMEALPVAERLGLSAAILQESRHFLQRGSKP